MDVGATPAGGLRRNLGLGGTVGVALAMMGPTTSMAVGVAPVVKWAGLSAPTAFVAGFLAMVLVALSFATFARRVATAGSARDYIGLAWGPRAGFLAGWLLLFGYGIVISGNLAMTGDLLAATLAELGIGGPHLWLWLALGAGGVATWLCLRDIRVTGRAMLVLEWTSMLALLVLAAVILMRTPLSAAPFVPAAGHGWSGIGLGMVFAVFAFIGFEGPATLGEEAQDPHRTIPRAILGTLAAAGIFYVLISYAEVAGFGPKGLGAMAQDPSPLGTLSRRFISGPFAVLVNAAAAISMFSIATSILAAASRVLMSLARGGFLPAFTRTSRDHGVPRRAILALATASVLGILAVRNAPTPVDYFAALGSIATLAIILVYMGVTGAELTQAVRERRVRNAVPALAGLLILIWPLFNSLYPVPPWPEILWPYVVIGWTLLGFLLLLVRPEISRSSTQPYAKQPITIEKSKERAF